MTNQGNEFLAQLGVLIRLRSEQTSHVLESVSKNKGLTETLTQDKFSLELLESTANELCQGKIAVQKTAKQNKQLTEKSGHNLQHLQILNCHLQLDFDGEITSQTRRRLWQQHIWESFQRTAGFIKRISTEPSDLSKDRTVTDIHQEVVQLHADHATLLAAYLPLATAVERKKMMLEELVSTLTEITATSTAALEVEARLSVARPHINCAL